MWNLSLFTPETKYTHFTDVSSTLFMQLRILCLKYLQRGCEKTGLSPVNHTRDEVMSACSMNLVYKQYSRDTKLTFTEGTGRAPG